MNAIPAGVGEEFFRTLSRTFSGKSRHDADAERLEDEVFADDDSTSTKVDTWRLAADVKGFQNNDPTEGRRLGVTWTDLTVKVVPSNALIQENFASQFNALRQIRESRSRPELRTILDSSRGCVKPGEMLLVLGRPGSGCSTLLRMLANKRKGYVRRF